MKILHIVNDLIRGGTEGQCARVAMGLAGRGDREHHVAVFLREGFFLNAVEEACGAVFQINISHLREWNTLKSVYLLRKWMKRERFDVIHTWDAESTIFGGLAAVLAGIPLITSRRDLGEIYPRWKQVLLARADKRAIRVVVNARAIGTHFVGEGVDENKIVFIPNVLDLHEFDALAGEEKTKKGYDELNIVCVSRLDPEKDHQCLLDAFSLYLGDKSAKKARLHLIGDGMERENLENQAKELGISENVVFLGEQMDVPSRLKHMDIGVLVPKSNEGLSNSILEYLAASLPVVCTDCGGNAELVDDGRNGLVVGCGDAKAMARAFSCLAARSVREKMGREGRCRLDDEFGQKRALDGFQQLYQDLESV